MAIANQPGFNFDPTKLSDKELQDYLAYFENLTSRPLPGDATPGQFSNREGWQRTLQRLREVQGQRETQVRTDQEQKRLMEILGVAGGAGGGSGGASGPVFDPQAYLAEQQGAAQAQRNAIEDIFKTVTPQQTQALNEVFNQQRGQAIEEAAAAGNLRQPAFMSSVLGRMDADRGKAMADLFANLGSKRSESLLGVEERLAEAGRRGREFAASLGQDESHFGRNLDQSRRMNLANLLQGGGQFQQTFGLERDKFGEAKAQNALENLFNRESLAQADRLGKMQASANKPSALSQITGLVGGAGQLIGGISDLAGTFSTFGKPKAKKPIGPVQSSGVF